MGNWMNSDSLYLKFGTDKATANRAGEHKTFGDLREIQLKMDLTTLTTATTIQSDQTFLPSGIVVEEVEVVAISAASTTSTATLNVGLVKTDRTTVLTATSLVNGLTTTSMDAAGEKVVLRVGSTGAGGVYGTTTTAVHYITASTSTGTFNAGNVVLRIRYKTP